MPERAFVDIAKVEIADDRGQRRTVPFIDIWGPARGFACTPPAGSLPRIRRQILRGTWFIGGLVGVVTTAAIAVIFTTAALIQLAISSGRFNPVALLIATPLIIIGYERLALPVFRRVYRPTYVKATLGEDLCPFCLYQFGETPRADDGCRVCPECAGAWRKPEPEQTPQPAHA